MLIHFLAAYYPQSAHAKISPRSSSHWEAYKFCQAVKHGVLNDELTFEWKERIERIHAGDTFKPRAIFGYFLKKKIFDRGIRDPVIVPVPSKDASLGRYDFRSYQMVREAIQGDLNYPVVPSLRFTERLAPASLGGPRDISTLYSFMEIVGDLPRGSVILVDDIMTTGAAMKAAYKRLSESNTRVVGAIVCGRTVYKTNTAAFGDHQLQVNWSNFDSGAHGSNISTWRWL